MLCLYFLKNPIIKFLFVILLIASLVSTTFIVHAKPTQTSGKTGDVTWSFSDGHLVFSGNGATEELDFYSVGNWYRWGDDIKKVTFEEGITRIGAWLFNDGSLYKNIKSIYISTTVREIGEGAFTSLPALESVHIKNLSRWCGINFEGNGAVGNPLDQKADLYLKGNIVENLVIPSDVTEICNFAFKGCQSIKTVTLHSGVKKVGSFAFNTCSNLKEIYFHGDVPTFGKAVFTLSSVTAFYPEGNKTWTDNVLKGYGGEIIWKTHTLVKPDTITESGKAPAKKPANTTSVEQKPSTDDYTSTSSETDSADSTDAIADSSTDTSKAPSKKPDTSSKATAKKPVTTTSVEQKPSTDAYTSTSSETESVASTDSIADSSTDTSKAPSKKTDTSSKAPAKKPVATTSVEQKPSTDDYTSSSSETDSVTSTDAIVDSSTDTTEQNSALHTSSIDAPSNDISHNFGFVIGIITAMFVLMIIATVVFIITKKKTK